MITFVGIVAAVFLLALLAFTRRPKPGKKKWPSERRQIPKQPDKRFHAVSLRFPSSACDAAKATGGQRFLSAAAPRLPLADCDVANCKCRYVHYKDRRSGDDRRDTYGQVLAVEIPGITRRNNERTENDGKIHLTILSERAQ